MLCRKAASSISRLHADTWLLRHFWQASHLPHPSVFSLGPSVHAALVLPHLIAADVHFCLNTLCGSTTLQRSFRNHFSVVINAALVSSVPLKMQLCLWVKGQTVHQRSMITNQREMVTGSRRGARTEMLGLWRKGTTGEMDNILASAQSFKDKVSSRPAAFNQRSIFVIKTI